METVQTKPATHPLFITAAVSLIILSALGSAAILGWLPRSSAQPAASVSVGPEVVAPAAPVAATPAVTAKEATPAAPAPKAVARTEPRRESRPVVSETAPTASASNAPAHQAETHRAETDRPRDERPVLADARDSLPPPPPPVVAQICRECGVIESVNEVEKAGEGSGLGAVAGGIFGAIAGKQVGGGRGRNVMSVLGAVGGAVAGNQIEKHVKTVKSYDITIRFEDGSTRTLSQPNPPAWRSGDRVRFINGSIQPNA